MRAIHTDEAPAPAGHYSQAIVHDGVAYVSGQLPMDPKGKALGDASVQHQTRVVLGNIDAILRAAGSGLDRALQVTIYVTDIAHWPAVNEAYIEVMGDHRPARAVIPVNELHYGVALEVQAIAAV
ncbi:MAG: RidA family protein [Gemmatimonadetes bacterium]|nr:RidA family protein [Gemmatimonadota bacterium]